MAKTKVESIRKRLEDNYSAKKVHQYYRLQKFAFGESAEDFTDSLTNNSIVDLPSVEPDYLEIGRSRRILNHSFINMSKILYADPAPEFPGVDSDIQEIRKEFFRARSTDNKYGTSWANEIASCYLDGDSLGLGFCQIGVVEGEKGQRIAIKYVPVHQVVYDRLEKSPHKSRWIAFISYLTEDIAIDTYGIDIWNKYKTTRFPQQDSLDYKCTSLRIIEYYDLGYGLKGEPTYAVFADNFEGEVLKLEPNPYKILPYACFQSWTPPGCFSPCGRIIMQMSTQQAINELEEHQRLVIERGVPFTLLDKSQIDSMDFENLQDGEQCTYVGFNPSQGNPFIRVPGAEVSQTLLQYQNYLERQLSTESGLSDLDRSNTLPTVKSATEISILQSSSQIQGAWNRKQLALLYKQIIEKSFAIARDYDRDPLVVNIAGQQITLNDPQDPKTWIEFYLTEEGTVYVDETSLDYKDKEQESLKKLTVLNQLTPEVQAGLIDPIEFVKLKLQALGLSEKLIKQPEVAPPGAAGLPPELMAMMAQGMPQGAPQAPPQG